MRSLPFDYAVRNLGRSTTRLLLSVGGSALVVMLVITAAAFVRGMDAALRMTGRENNVILLGAGSEESVERSEIEAGVAGILAASLNGVRVREGVAYVSPEVHVQLPVQTQIEQVKRPLVLVRGVTPAAMLVHDALQIVNGRFPVPGANEVMVGRMVPTKLGVGEANLGIGETLLIDNRPWAVVGEFAAPGTIIDAEVWAPLDDLKQATKRATDSCVVLTLEPEKAEFADVAAFTKTRVDLELAAVRESAYYLRLADFFAPIRLVAWVTAGLIALGGLFGGLNTMYAAFASRLRELGTLQSLGFRKSAIVLSLMQESTLATAAGALVACSAGMLLLDGIAVRFSMGAFGLRVDALVLSVGLVSGLALGLLGALPPAWRCLRFEIPVALKAI
ncbi:MAG TPA: ABC transporter permease [Phycisphaerae bacterium]|nr:ABC transporter permease [Phycisphaerae bacterium]